ncbi:TadE/TadG family type IV pilus assembly protein [Labrenzia sp. PHM005]|uniref:TadE/TadG family type IV pilus assembly protein n=1 Tax=Labrenzia sp. PHM005 TaxID=2590016 RepID=UPI001AD90819|nr:TadE/TadG family type IV pilus assembly protein [Labrenzia sp. PHM005]
MQVDTFHRMRNSPARIWLRRRLRSFARDKDGVTAIEFAFVALPFFTVVFGILELGLAFLVNRMVDNAVIEASRLIRTGQATSSSFSANDFADQVCNALPGFLCQSDRIRVNVSKANDFTNITSLDSLYDSEGNIVDDNAYASSNESEIVVVNVVYRWPMFSSFMNLSALDHGSERHLSSTMVFRNEPWS